MHRHGSEWSTNASYVHAVRRYMNTEFIVPVSCTTQLIPGDRLSKRPLNSTSEYSEMVGPRFALRSARMIPATRCVSLLSGDNCLDEVRVERSEAKSASTALYAFPLKSLKSTSTTSLAIVCIQRFTRTVYYRSQRRWIWFCSIAQHR